MAPPPPPPEFVEVGCAGCGETLEVEPGLSEFACPDCGTQQRLPPELMPPPPPRPRRALPIPSRRPAAAAPVPVPVPVPVPMSLPCGACSGLLSVPAGLTRFACPLCGVELTVDGGRLRVYLASPPQPTVSVLAPPPAGITLRPSQHRRFEGQIEKYNHLTRSVHREEAFSSSRTEAIHTMSAQKEPSIHSAHREGSRIEPLSKTIAKASERTVQQGQIEKYNHPTRSVHREEAFSSSRTEAIHTMLAQKEPSIHSAHREGSRIQPLSKTIAKASERTTKLPACLESTGVVRPEPPVHSSSASRAQVRPSNYSFRAQEQQPAEDTASQGEHINEYRAVSSTLQHETIETSNQVNRVEQDQGEYHSKATGWNLKRKRSGGTASGRKGKKKGLPCYPNGGPHLRRSARLSKQPENPINNEPAQQPATSNQCNSDLDLLNIDKIISNLCRSPSPQLQMPQASSNQSGKVDVATGPPLSNHNASQDRQLPLCSQLYPPEVPGEQWLDRSGDEQPHSPDARFHDVHMQGQVQQEDAQRGHHSLLGSVVKSSGKGRGRGHQPTKLTQPRREVDRPVLTPNIADKWDVNPPCPKVASTITVLLKQKYPGSTYLPAGQRREDPPNGEIVLHWRQYPPETRDVILNEFLQRYKWAPGREAECLKVFERRAARQFACILSQEKRNAREKFAALDKSNETSGAHRSDGHAESEEEDQEEEPKDQQALERIDDEDPFLWKPFPPAWMLPNWWQRLCEHWAKEDVLKMSSQNRKNRFTNGRAHHTSGSRSIAMHRQLMVIENGGMPVSELEVFNKTHRRKGGAGEFVSERAKQTVEGFTKRMEEAGDKNVDPLVAWVQQVGGRNRGRYYGLTGIIDKDKVDELAKSMPRQKFTQEQVQQMINQALQGLNETWEQKFKSLEQSVRGVTPLGSDRKHAPGSSAAREGGQEDQLRHLDASDSHTGGSNEDDDVEVVSTSV